MRLLIRKNINKLLTGVFIGFGAVLLCASDCFAAQELSWGRIKFDCAEPDAQEDWDTDEPGDHNFLRMVEKYTTLKVNQKWNIVPLSDLNEMLKYPLLLMTSSGTPKFKEEELKNIKEYLIRGGFLFADDSNWPAKGGDLFFAGKVPTLKKMFPDGKLEPLLLDHDVFHCFFDICCGNVHRLPQRKSTGLVPVSPSRCYGFFDKQGRMMVFLSLLIQNHWSGLNPEYQELALKLGINIVIYGLTH